MIGAATWPAPLSPLSAWPRRGRTRRRPVRLSEPPDPARGALWPRRRRRVGMRIMAEKLSVRLKQNVVIENRPGAGGIVAAKAVATGAPRLQHPDDRQQQRHRRGAVQVAALRHPEGLPPTSTVSFFDLLIIVKTGSPLKKLSGRRQRGEGEPRQAEHRHHQSRQYAESRRRVVQERQRHPGADRAVPHLGRHGDRAPARRSRHHVRVLHRRAWAAHRQQGRGAGVDRPQAQRLSAGGADGAGGRHQGLRGFELERALGAGGDSEADHRYAGEGA